MTKSEQKRDLVHEFLSLCPDFAKRWSEHLRYWGDDALGEFNDIAEFARFLVERYADNRTEDFPAIFALVERLLIDGDERTKEILTIGLIEDIQNIASHTDFGADVFLPWIGPQSKSAWELLAALWIKYLHASGIEHAVSAYHHIMLGGVTAYGQDASNELTRLCHEVTAELKLNRPQIGLRVHRRHL